MADPDLAQLGRVLVTGAAGRIGSAIVRRLVDEGVPVTALDRVRAEDSPADRIITGDASEEDVVAAALADVAAVAHLGAIPTPRGHAAYSVFRGNTSATFNVLDQAGRRGISRAVIASSINATGLPFNTHAVLPAYFPIDEDLPIDLCDAYSLSKQVDEHTARMIARRDGMAIVALRFPLVVAPDRHTWLSQYAREHPEQSAREGWSYLDLRDAVEAVCLALVRPVTGAVIMGVAAPDNTAGLDTAELLSSHAPEVPVRVPVTGTMSLYSADRATQILGWRAHYLRTGEHE